MGRTAKIKTIEPNTTMLKCKCIRCEHEYEENEFYVGSMKSEIFSGMKKIPICKTCIEKLYQYYVELYTTNQYKEPEKKAIIRLCMAFDIYYSDNIFESAMKKTETKNTSLIAAYFTIAALSQNRNKKNYDTSLFLENDIEDSVISYDDIKDTQKVKETETYYFFFQSN